MKPMTLTASMTLREVCLATPKGYDIDGRILWRRRFGNVIAHFPLANTTAWQQEKADSLDLVYTLRADILTLSAN